MSAAAAGPPGTEGWEGLGSRTHGWAHVAVLSARNKCAARRAHRRHIKGIDFQPGARAHLWQQQLQAGIHTRLHTMLASSSQQVQHRLGLCVGIQERTAGMTVGSSSSADAAFTCANRKGSPFSTYAAVQSSKNPRQSNHWSAGHPPSGSARPALCTKASSCWNACASCWLSHSIRSVPFCPPVQPLIQRLHGGSKPSFGVGAIARSNDLATSRAQH